MADEVHKDHTSIETVDEDFGMTINGGIGDGKGDGKSAYHVQVDE